MSEHSKSPREEPDTTTPTVPGFIGYHNPGNTNIPAIQITPPPTPPPEATVTGVERTEPIERAYTFSMMQKVPPEEQEYRDETGYGKKEQKGAFGLACGSF